MIYINKNHVWIREEKEKSRVRAVSPELERWHRVHGDMEAGDRLVDVLL